LAGRAAVLAADGAEAPPRGHRPPLALLLAWLGARGAGAQRDVWGDEGLTNMFHNMDLNGDRRLDKDEFVKGTTERIVQHKHRGSDSSDMRITNEVKWFLGLFDKADTDGDGALSWEEAEGLDRLVFDAMQGATDTVRASLEQVVDFNSSPATVYAGVRVLADLRSMIADERRVETLGQAATEYLGHVREEWPDIDPRLEPWFRLVFKKCDMDSDGILSDEEAKFAFQIVVDILMAAHKRMQPSDEPYLRFKLVGSVEDVMRQLDLNGDGKVDLEEMSAAKSGPMPPGEFERLAAEVFQRHDADGDGRLDSQELTQLLTSAETGG